MATHRQPALLTVDDYLGLPDDGKRYELLEGELVLVPSPNASHQRIVRGLAFRLDEHVRDRKLGEIFFAPFDVILAERVVVQPDILYVSRERAEIVLPAHVRGAPDLVVEVVSPASAKRDLLDKRRIYARYGVPHYWVVAPAEREIVAFSLGNRDYEEVAAAAGDETFSAPPFPDLAIPLGEVWG